MSSDSENELSESWHQTVSQFWAFPEVGRGPAVILDPTTTDAFVGSGLKSNLVMQRDLGVSERFAKSIAFDYFYSSRFRRRTLETLLLFDHIYLSSLSPLFDLTPLKNEGLDIHVIPPVTEMVDKVHPHFDRFFNKHMRLVLKRKFRNLFEYGKIKGQSPANCADAFMGGIFDLLHEGLPLISLIEASDSIQDGGQDEQDMDLMVFLFERVAQRLTLSRLKNFKGFFDCLVLTVNTIKEFWYAFVFCLGTDVPLYSRAFNYIPTGDDKNIDDLAETMVLCKIAMREEMNVTPIVETIEDFLRLRNDRRVCRFRGLVWQWKDIVASENEGALRRIKRDIRRANRELKTLKKWQTASLGWIFWFEVVAGLIPFLNYLLAVEQVARHGYMSKLEKQSSWVGLWQ